MTTRTYYPRGHRCCACFIVPGAALMTVALFLHPMSPGDFLLLALLAPLETLRDSQGIRLAVLFWLGFPVAVAGAVRLLHRFTRTRGPESHASFALSAPSAPGTRGKRYGNAGNEDIEESWSFM